MSVAHSPKPTEIVCPCWLTRFSVATILLFSSAFLICNLGYVRVLTYHEVHFAQPAREMLATGDWLVPRVAGVPFTDKPPLTAWLIAGAMTVCRADNEWVARLPSAVAALITALILAATTARWFGDRVGRIAGLVQLSCYYSLQMATLAETDMNLIASITGAMCMFAWSQLDSPVGRHRGRWVPWAFYFFMGLSFLVKGPIGPFFILSGTGLLTLCRRQWSAWRLYLNPVGLGILALCVVPYPALAFTFHPPMFAEWVKHNLGRFQGELGVVPGNESAWFYLYHLPYVLLPWFPFVLGATLLKDVRRHPLTLWALCWLVPGMVMLSLSSWKAKHYLSPLLPGFTVLGAVGLDRFQQWRAGQAELHTRAWSIAIAAAAGLGTAVVLMVHPQNAAAIAAVLILGGLVWLAILQLERRRLPGLQLGVIFATFWCFIVATYLLVLPDLDTYRERTILAQRINESLPRAVPLFIVDLPKDQIVYYLRGPVQGVDELKDFEEHLPELPDCPVYVVTTERAYQKLHAISKVDILDRCDSLRWFEKPDTRAMLIRLQRRSHVTSSLPKLTATSVVAEHWNGQ